MSMEWLTAMETPNWALVVCVVAAAFFGAGMERLIVRWLRGKKR